MSREQNRIHALEQLACDQAIELNHIRKEYAEMLQRNGEFCAAVIMAAFGHQDPMSHEQIINSLKTARHNQYHNPSP